MQRQTITSRGFIILVLILQFIPLVLFPPDQLAGLTEATWLGISLAIMALVSVLALLVGRVRSIWPWNLLSFSHGFNIISRLLMLWPNVVNAGGANGLYLVIAAVAMVLSVLFLWYNEVPDVRTRLAREA